MSTDQVMVLLTLGIVAISFASLRRSIYIHAQQQAERLAVLETNVQWLVKLAGGIPMKNKQ